MGEMMGGLTVRYDMIISGQRGGGGVLLACLLCVQHYRFSYKYFVSVYQQLEAGGEGGG